MANLARDFARIRGKKAIENATERDFHTLKDIALDLHTRLIALEDMYEKLMKERLIGKD
jgi:hypothetical protein